ncbi:MAG TPA: ABC transporter substrate-binding protein [Rhizomicrobium sp.]|jgi:iron complex transport system substrate-binding protein|nr:ABC transporter substrate-binding protein [Rhizomicrobium sp.]
MLNVLTRRARRLAAPLLAAAVAFTAGAAGDPPPGDRVVCVSKQINEFIYDIGAENHLIARDLTSIYPPAIRTLPNVGYHRALSAEGIVSLRPSILLTDGNVGPNEVLDRVRSVGIPVVTMDPGETLDSAEALMQRLGDYFGRHDASAQLVAGWKRDMAQTVANADRSAPAKRPSVLFIHFGQIANDYLGLAPKGPAEQILEWAGGRNALTAGNRMTRLTPEVIAGAQPDVIIATDVGFDRYGSAEKFAAMPGVALTPAGRHLRIYRIDETEIMYFSPRTPAAVTKIAHWLHGG